MADRRVVGEGAADAPRRWWALAAITTVSLVMGLDMTILTVALPTIAIDLDASTSQLQWFVAGYTLVLAAGMLPAGTLGDRVGGKGLFLAALVLFAGASIGCAYAGSAGLLIVARVVRGVGAAFLIPLSVSLVSLMFPAGERARAIGIWTTAIVAGIPIGPVLGGWLLERYWWGSVFLVNVPLVLISGAALVWLLPRTPGDAASGRIDVTGIALSSTGLIALTYGLIGIGHRGWSPAVLVPVAAGAVLLALFGYWMRRAPRPLFDPGMFRSVGFTSGSLLAAVAAFTLVGAVFVLPQYFQAIWGVDAQETGLRVLPVVGGLLVGVQVGLRSRPVVGARVLIAAGFGLMTAGLLIGARTDLDDGYLFVAVWTAVIGLGLGMSLPLALDVALDGVAAGRSGAGAGMIQTFRQLGSTLGVAVLGAALNARYRASVDVTGLPEPVADSVRGTAAAGVMVARSTGSADLLESVQVAFVRGMGAMLLTCAAVTALAALAALAVLPRPGVLTRAATTGQLADDNRAA